MRPLSPYGDKRKTEKKEILMKKLTLTLILALMGLGLANDAVARHCGSCRKSCKTSSCAPKCASECGGNVTYSESGQPCCIKRYVCERQFPADKHVHVTYTCPSECIEMNGDYKVQTQQQEISDGSY
jgi:hypothetical protein